MKNRLIVFCAGLALYAAKSFAMPANEDAAAVEVRDVISRSLAAIDRDVQAALKAEAVSRRRGANVAEVVRLTELYRELAAHPQRDESLVAWELGVKLRSRLREVSAIVERRSISQHPQSARVESGPATVNVNDTVLAQQLPAPRARGGQVVAPGVAVPGAQPAAGAVVDYGPQLVELIQITISPGTWNINGGPGAVVYYQPLRVLVVSAPGDVQNQFGGVVGRLRRP